MKRDETVLKMICNQWVGSSNLSSGTTDQGFHKIYINVSLTGLHWGYKVYDSKDTYNHWNFIYSCWSIIPIFERYWVGKTAR